MTSPPLRGQIWYASLSHVDNGAQKPFVIVSNNQRNKLLDSVLAVRVTTSVKHGHFDSQVRLPAGSPVVGTVICDDVEMIYRDELKRCAGGLTVPVLATIEDGLRAALGLRY